MNLIQVGYAAHESLGASPAENRMQERAKATLAYAEKWGPVFGAPLSWLLAVAEKESGHDPRKINMRARHKGGAWGLMQQMANETPYKMEVIRKFYARRSDPYAARVKATLAKWRGRPQTLLDPDFNTMLAAWQLGRLNRVFDGDFANAIAAYHQGEFAVKRRIEKGLPAVSPTAQPNGFAYVTEVAKMREKYLPLLIARLDEVNSRKQPGLDYLALSP